jgi:hypothetical protein
LPPVDTTKSGGGSSRAGSSCSPGSFALRTSVSRRTPALISESAARGVATSMRARRASRSAPASPPVK